MSPEPWLIERLDRYGQSHLLRWWAELAEGPRIRLASEVAAIDFDRLDRLIGELVHGEGEAVPSTDRVRPIAVERLPQTDGERVAQAPRRRDRGRRTGGGRGRRDHRRRRFGDATGIRGAQGDVPHRARLLGQPVPDPCREDRGAGRRFGRPIPLYIMTSPENHQSTVDFFQAHDQFGLDHVRFFVQGQMPAVDRATGKVLLATRDHVALSPDGHGGTLAALAAPGPDGTPSCLDEMCGGRSDPLLLSGR